MCPGMRPATGWIAYVTSTPRASSRSASARTSCCACATAMPYPGTITTFCAYASITATSSAVVGRTDAGATRGRRGCTGRHLPEGAEEDVRDRAVHRPPHLQRQQRSRRADEHAGDDQDVVLELEAGRSDGEAGERVEQRDHDGHVGAADREHEQHAEEQRGADQHPEQPLVLNAGDQRDPGRDAREEHDALPTCWPG